jgi:hypothetical protein
MFSSNRTRHAAAMTWLSSGSLGANCSVPVNVTCSTSARSPFWEAEPEHQGYLERYPGGYTCHFARPAGSCRTEPTGSRPEILALSQMVRKARATRIPFPASRFTATRHRQSDAHRSISRSLASGAERDEPDAELRKRRDDLGLRGTPPQRVLLLQRRHRLHGVGAADCARRGLRHAEVAHLARADQLAHGAGGVLDRDVRVDAVLVKQVNVVDAQAAMTLPLRP